MCRASTSGTPTRVWSESAGTIAAFLSVGGMITNGKEGEDLELLGVLLGGESLMKKALPGYVRRQLFEYGLLMAIAHGDPFSAEKTRKPVPKYEKRILQEIKSRCGWPKPVK